MIARERHLHQLHGLLQRHPIVAILGARQVGKTTLARQLSAGWLEPTEHFDLENPVDVERLTDPMLALGDRTGLVVLDEVQRLPEIFRVLRVLADRPDSRARFLVLGSASPELLRQSSESLAGRIHYHELPGFALDEVGLGSAGQLWLRGGFPRSYLAGSDEASAEWRRDFIQTFLSTRMSPLWRERASVLITKIGHSALRMGHS